MLPHNGPMRSSFSGITICIQAHEVHSCSTSGANTWTQVIKHVCRWPSLRDSQSDSWAGRPSAISARRGNIWPPLSTDCSYLAWRPLTGFCQMLSECERPRDEPRERGGREDGERGGAVRTTPADPWLSAFKGLAATGAGRDRLKCFKEAQGDRWWSPTDTATQKTDFTGLTPVWMQPSDGRPQVWLYAGAGYVHIGVWLTKEKSMRQF